MFVFYWVETYRKKKIGNIWVAEVGKAPIENLKADCFDLIAFPPLIANESSVEAFTEITGMVTPSECVWMVPGTIGE